MAVTGRIFRLVGIQPLSTVVPLRSILMYPSSSLGGGGIVSSFSSSSSSRISFRSFTTIPTPYIPTQIHRYRPVTMQQIPFVSSVIRILPYYPFVRIRYQSTSSSSSTSSPPNTTIDETTLYKDQNSTWVDRYVPSSLIPYLKLTRIDRPIGTWLVLLPGWWGLSWCYSLPISSISSFSSLTTLLTTVLSSLPIDLYLYFGIGAFLMRSAGCTVNDIWDRHYDRLVARTRQRPLASNQLTLWKALVFLIVQLLLGFYILLQLNILTLYMGILAVPLVCIYPLMKRYTYFPQFILGLAMSYGIWMGYTSSLDRTESTWDRLQLWYSNYYNNKDRSLSFTITSLQDYLVPNKAYFDSLYPRIHPSITSSTPVPSSSSSSSSTFPWVSFRESINVLVPFYIGAVNWTIVYDTIYAYQDIHDDKRLGLKSTAIWMGNRGKLILTGLSILGVGLPWTLAGYRDTTTIGSVYYAAVTIAVMHLLYQCQTMDFNDRINLTKRFTWNRYIGWIMLTGILGGRIQSAQNPSY